MKLDQWQREVLEHDGDLLLCTGRQVGKTTIFARKAAEYLVKHKGSRIIIVSLTEDQAKLIVVMMLDFLERNHNRLVAKGKNKPTQNKITLTNGSRAIARPVGTTGDAVRGFTGDVLIIDEASRMPQLVWDAAKPVLLTTGGQIWMCSTPHGKQGYFYEAFLNKDGRYKVFHISSEEVIYNRPASADWDEKIRERRIKNLENEKNTMSKVSYGQEYLGLFMDDLQQFFDDDLIESCCKLKKDPNLKGKSYLGVDIARLGGDDNSYQVVTELNGKFYHQESISQPGKLTTETERDIITYSKLWKVKKVGIDAGSGSLGVGVYDHLRETNLRNKVVAMNNRAMIMDDDKKEKVRMAKEDYYNNLKAMMEHREIKLLDDDKVKLSLKSVQAEYVYKNDEPTKLMIFSNPHSESHIIEALVRAAYLARKEKALNLWAA